MEEDAEYPLMLCLSFKCKNLHFKIILKLYVIFLRVKGVVQAFLKVFLLNDIALISLRLFTENINDFFFSSIFCQYM